MNCGSLCWSYEWILTKMHEGNKRYTIWWLLFKREHCIALLQIYFILLPSPFINFFKFVYFSILYNLQFWPIFNFVQFPILFNFNFVQFQFCQLSISSNFVHFSVLSNLSIFQFGPFFSFVTFCSFVNFVHFPNFINFVQLFDFVQFRIYILSRAVDWNFQSCFLNLRHFYTINAALAKLIRAKPL